MNTSASDQIDIPKSWKTAAHKIICQQYRKILILGAGDRGKSVYCIYLANQFGASESTVAFVDADIGQKDVGLPATISLARVKPEQHLTQAKPIASYFVGAVSPARHFLSMVIGTRKMVDMAQSDITIIDTTGLVHGSGRTLKGFQIESLQPDAIVTLEKDNELDAIVNAYSNFTFLRITPSRYATKKSSRARKKAREKMFKVYFAHAREITLDISRTRIQRLPLFSGTTYDDPRFVYAERNPDGTTAVVKEKHTQKYPGVYTLPFAFERNLLCGLADRKNIYLGLGILKRIHYQNRTITLLTPVAKRQIKIVQFGDMYVSPEGKEIRHGLLTTRNNRM
jgi:polynucleotide 5'-hydroxyl-kinase GRC3/NOL9